MKRIITLFFALAALSFSFAQSNGTTKGKLNAKYVKEAPISVGQTDINIQPRSVDCIWESDFSDASDWNLDHDSDDCSLDWEIGEGLECSGSYPIDAVVSDNGFYAMLDSDAYGGEEGGTETEDSWLTMASSVDCSQYDNVIVEFDTWYRSYNSEKCFLVVSTDGTFPSNLTPSTEADPENGIYEIFPDISSVDVGGTVATNPTTRRVNISEAAGGQSEVWIRFNWTGTWGYAWFIDRVCVAQQPSDDITLSYGVVSHNGTGEEYGRVPGSQLGNSEVYTAAGVYNFGVNDAEDIQLEVAISGDGGAYVLQSDYPMYGFDNDGYLDLSSTLSGPVASDVNVYFEDTTPIDAASELYTATFTVESSTDSEGGEYAADNSATREFAVTDGLYSSDGIDVYSNPDVSRMGTGSFLDASDGFMMMAYYDIAETTALESVTIMLDSYMYTTPLSVPGGELVVALRDTTLISATTFDPGDGVIATSDFYLVTQDDIDAGFISVPMNDVEMTPEAYYISVEMYSNGNETDIYIMDDETIPQPSYLSMIYIPGDQVYSNGEAVGIRMVTNDAAVGLEEKISAFNVYPNPSNGILNIELNETGIYSIQINDIVGKLISNENINTNTTLNLQHLNKGIYFVNVSNDQTTHITKIVIE